MSYQVLARKWRPRDFATTVGQDHVVRALTHALDAQRLHHAYLFTGTRGVGKTTLARILAKALNCVGPDGRGSITSTPCNQCEACVAIDAGRFVDYIEMDAASNRGVDEMTTLLERAVYAPSNARFKVYMIDEVHMLTNHAFNAMLKTLEEPPDYVKFILATTDPQKIPVTVLSRCLQFNLKQMTPTGIQGRLEEILQAEGVSFELGALRALAQAAHGSMRDALSLLDQTIAYGGGSVTLESVQQMLGAVDTGTLERVLDALATRDARAAVAVADEMQARSFSLAQALRDLASLLHRIALVQQIPDSAGGDSDAEMLARYAARFATDEVQLYYQVALHGRNDMALAPDEYAGFTMALLRMMAFAPTDGLATAVATPAVAAVPARAAALAATPAPRASAPVPVRPAAAAPAPAPAVPSPASRAVAGADWPAFAAQLTLAGLARELAHRSELIVNEGDHFRLRVPIKSLAEAGTVERLRAAIAEHLGRPARVSVEVGMPPQNATAAGQAEQARAERQKRAEEAIYADPFVREVIENFGAEVDPRSIRPKN
jgi:DNA polymerase III subunit gamma/tau